MSLLRSLGAWSSGKNHKIHPLWCVFVLLKGKIWWKMTENWGQNLVCKLPKRCGCNFCFLLHFQNRHIRLLGCKISWLLLEVYNSFMVLLHYLTGIEIWTPQCSRQWWISPTPQCSRQWWIFSSATVPWRHSGQVEVCPCWSIFDNAYCHWRMCWCDSLCLC